MTNLTPARPHIIYNFTITEALYSTIKRSAEINHNTVQGELEERIIISLNPEYGYNTYHRLNLYLHLKCWNDADYYLQPQPSNKNKKFDFTISKHRLPTYSKIKFSNAEILNRLAFTVVDPFYDEFKDHRVLSRPHTSRAQNCENKRDREVSIHYDTHTYTTNTSTKIIYFIYRRLKHNGTRLDI